MHKDARITLYGGVTIGIGLLLLGIATGRTIDLSLTGLGIMGAAFLVAVAYDYLTEE